MVWQEISIKVPQEYVEPVSYLFSRYGHGLSIELVESGPVLLRTYLQSTSKRRLARIEVGVNLVRILQPMGNLEIKDLEDADWESSWKAHFTLQKVGRRLVVKPSWIDYEPAVLELVIELDPGMAFGTGYHPTTRMCLEAMEQLETEGMEVLDMGTGSAILSIASAKLGAASVLALDIDPIAVKAARKNIRSSGLKSIVQLARGTLTPRYAQERRFDLAVANISAKVIQDMAPRLHLALKPGGTLVASGFLEKQRPELEQALLGAGFSLLKTFQTEDWVALVLLRDSSVAG